ncbi:M14 family zinc carboxypeptidase [Actinacidiphila guanduensis]|uniref:Zinc carboxypeptidase n=1 Tax=Actinacidiphila guanduensis TaxID=310781 RepID=A0A1H0QY66_9ACTN|nr:M14 family zinc carboxypeptidase [Actinacidiphila guanduensis]SDP22177.1 Zinc carboxypeptidase [Actinacidiphila guanduensis]
MADAYPSVAGVAAAASAFAGYHPGLCDLRVIGRTRENRPMHLLTAGRGRRNVLVVAGPHSDERVGPATALRLAELVAQDPRLHAGADTTWHFLLCLDPDGSVRNETGPAVRRTPAAHFRHAYRPPADEQPEWAPSVRPADDQLPESRVLVDLIDELQPFLQCSLHGNDVGGSWIQLTRDLPGLSEPLGKLSAEHDVPVQTGTYDALFWTGSGPGVFVLPEPGEHDRFDSLPEDVHRSTWVRPHRYGGMTALFEVPMWAGRKVADPGLHPAPEPALAALARLLRRQSERTRVLLAEVRAVLPAGTPGRAHLLRVVDTLAGVCLRVADDWERLYPSPVPLTQAHLAALDIAARRIPLRALGMLLRLLEGRSGIAQDQVRAVCERQLARWADELEEGHQPVWVPVSAQAELQAQAVLATFRHLTEA